MKQREIKFRAWDKKRKKMIKVGEINFNQVGELDYIVSTNGDILGWDFILMQYTGLKDRNGKEIYEGDIVKCCKDGKEFIGEIIWGKFAKFLVDLCNLKNDGGIYDFSHFIYDEVRNRIVNLEVIGNIFENPELLKRSQKEVKDQ